ncbi:unnamed protein product [Leptosia nina]|uniref:Uncharacterized protein n=1 Tax=Leptosia nina TaxID=320188 RepID=A0AAV1JJB8_9NEOP
MLTIFCVLILFFPFGTLCQTWHSRACLDRHLEYLEEVFQRTLHRLENDVKFCNLKIDDFNQSINNQMYSWRVAGTIHYTNNFLISIEMVDVTRISSMVTRRMENNIPIYQAGLQATINFHNPRLGFDVFAELEDMEDQRYTGVFLFHSITFPINIVKNINTNETAFTFTNAGSSARFARMDSLPNTNVSQVIGRNFQASLISNSFSEWGRNIIIPIMEKIVNTEIEFPTIKLDGCTG